MIFPAGYGNFRFLYMLGEHTLQFCELSSLPSLGDFMGLSFGISPLSKSCITKPSLST